MFNSPRWRLFWGLVVILALFGGLLWMINSGRGIDGAKVFTPEERGSYKTEGNATPAPNESLEPALEVPSPSAIPESVPSPSALPENVPSPSALPENLANPPSSPQESDSVVAQLGFVGQLKLVIPVSGVRPGQLRDTFGESRLEGRVHDAIDIPAPQGTAVVAAADGQIIKLFPSERGGTTIYQLDPDRKLVFYYAHLQRYAEGLVEGKFVRQGEVIGFVGDTGNAGTGNYHLHFSISIVADPKRYWEGTSVNPYPLLRKR